MVVHAAFTAFEEGFTNFKDNLNIGPRGCFNEMHANYAERSNV